MIRLFISKIDEENDVVCVSLTSSDGGKIGGKGLHGNMKTVGIPRKIPLNVILRPGKEYFVAEGEVKLIKYRVEDFKASLGLRDSGSLNEVGYLRRY